MKFNALYGKQQSLTNLPLQEGNLYITDEGLMYTDINKQNTLTRLQISDRADWNAEKGQEGYVHNRTHWVDQNRQLVCPETTTPIQYSSWVDINDDFPENFIQLLPGQQYFITINNADIYLCTAYEWNSGSGERLVFLGDSRLLQKWDSEEHKYYESAYNINPEDVPFIVENSTLVINHDAVGRELCENLTEFNIVSNIENPSIKIEEVLDGIRYNQIDERYLPDSILRTRDLYQRNYEAAPEEKGFIQNRTHYKSFPGIRYVLQDAEFQNGYFGMIKYGSWDFNTASAECIETGKTYCVIINGKRYNNLVAWQYLSAWGDSFFCLGDSRLTQILTYDENGDGIWIEDENGWWEPVTEMNMSNPLDVPFVIEYQLLDDGGNGVTWYHDFYISGTNIQDAVVSIGNQLDYCGEYHKIDAKYIPSIDYQADKIKNRTHWSEERFVQEILLTERYPYAENELVWSLSGYNDFSGNGFDMLFTPTLENRAEWVVKFNNETYVLKTWEHTMAFGDRYVCLGDSRLFWDTKVDENGEPVWDEETGDYVYIPCMAQPEKTPFVIFSYREDAFGNGLQWMEWGYMLFKDNVLPDAVEIGYYSEDKIYHKIDINYIPSIAATKKEVTDILGLGSTIIDTTL